MAEPINSRTLLPILLAALNLPEVLISIASSYITAEQDLLEHISGAMIVCKHLGNFMTRVVASKQRVTVRYLSKTEPSINGMSFCTPLSFLIDDRPSIILFSEKERFYILPSRGGGWLRLVSWRRMSSRMTRSRFPRPVRIVVETEKTLEDLIRQMGERIGQGLGVRIGGNDLSFCKGIWTSSGLNIPDDHPH